MPFRFLDDARADYDGEADYFDGLEPGVGDRWLVVADERITDVCRTAHVWPLYPGLDGVHVRVFRKPFAFNLIYAVDRDTVVIIAVARPGREPGYWRDRLK